MLVDPQTNFMLEKNKDDVRASTTQTDTNPSALGKNGEPIYAHCLDFTEGEQEYFYVGSEDFNIY